MAREHSRITKKVKEQMVKEFKDVRGITGNGRVFCGPQGGGVIDQSVCFVQQIRKPGKCSGCKEMK